MSDVKSFSKALFILCFLFIVSACSRSKSTSLTEQRALQSTALSQTFNVHDHVGDVHSSLDAIPPSRPFHVNQLSESIEIPVRDCTTPGLYEMEKQMALNEAAADPTGSTVPVKFSYSFGKKHDVLAKYANQRAVLSETNGGVSYIPVAGKKSNKFAPGKNAYYPVDNTEVARQYRTGERCFFSTLKVDPQSLIVKGGYFDFIDVDESDIPAMADLLKKRKNTKSKVNLIRHMVHFMYLGYCAVGRCAQGQAFAGEYANRLFQPVPSLENGEPQIIKLYMADLRSEQMKHDIVRLSEDTTRGVEIDSSIDNILNVCEVHKNYYDVTKNLSLPETVNGYQFDPIQGAVQLVNNILSHDVDGTLLSSQYTPIVIDLDGNGVKTSSVRWGTYFNMAALEDDDKGQGQAHRTAWIGGDYQDYNQGANPDPRVNLDVRLKSSDGFLVLPDDQGQVRSSTQMFGDNMMVAGKTYENGFEALRVYAGKNCDSSNVRNRYIGPWDKDIYENQLKIWVDENRNGVSEDGEIQSLAHHGIAAINACHIVHQDEEDAFGNGTHLRSAVLMQGDNENLLKRPAEIAYHLENGHGYEGEKSFFNLAIDLIFKVDEQKICPGLPKLALNYPGIDLGEEEEDDDDDSVGIPSVNPPTDPLPPMRPDNF